MREQEFCLAIISLVLNVNDLMKSEHLPEEGKKELAGDFKRLIRKVDSAKKAEARHKNGMEGGDGFEARCPGEDGLLPYPAGSC